MIALVSLDEERAALEKALNEGRGVTIYGEPGKPTASAEFVARLDDLPPSARRLAIAKACAIPWAERIDEMPECFRRELLRAAEDAQQDRAAYPEMDGLLDDLFAAVPQPFNPVFLNQIVEVTPTMRCSALLFVMVASWPGGPKAVLQRAPDAPQWLASEYAYASWAGTDERRAWRQEGWVA